MVKSLLERQRVATIDMWLLEEKKQRFDYKKTKQIGSIAFTIAVAKVRRAITIKQSRKEAKIWFPKTKHKGSISFTITVAKVRRAITINRALIWYQKWSKEVEGL